MNNQITTSQIVDNKTKKDRRQSKGRVLAISRRTYRLLNTDTYFVKSESSDNVYYFVRYNLQSLNGAVVLTILQDM